MRSRSVVLALCVSLLSTAGAVGAYVKATAWRTEAQWLLERGSAQAEAYADTFDGALADEQFKTFEERHAVLANAHLWQRVQLLLILVAVIAAISSYVLYLFWRLRTDLAELEPAEVPANVRA